MAIVPESKFEHNQNLSFQKKKKKKKKKNLQITGALKFI